MTRPLRFGVVVFPGSNGDMDMYQAVHYLDQSVDYIWHTETRLAGYDVILLPGGFSYGDYLRSGAIARFSPVMSGVIRAAEAGTVIVGICNGFQILLEAGLLPGAMLRNDSLQFRCEYTPVEVVHDQTMFTAHYQPGQVLALPIAHGEGSYYCDDTTLQALEQNKQILFRYRTNPNGSRADIAGICNRQGSVLGMMPHPERAVEAVLGSTAGKGLFTSIMAKGRARHASCS